MQVLLVVFVETNIASENVTEKLSLADIEVLSVIIHDDMVGVVVSTTKVLTLRLVILLRLSATLMRQLEYEPSPKVLKVTVLLPALAMVFELVQLPP